MQSVPKYKEIPIQWKQKIVKCKNIWGKWHRIEAKEINVSKSISLINDKNLKIGELRSGVYSPHFKKVIGIAMLEKPYFEVSQTFKISINDSIFEGKVCDLPFI